MAISTFAELQTTVIDWAMRSGDTGFAAAVPSFITFAEARINDRLRVTEMESSSTLTPDADGEATLPTDFLQMRSVRVNSSPAYTLERASPQFSVDRYSADAATGYPGTYSISGSTITTYPASSSTITVNYFAKVPALSDSNTSNWLLLARPNLYVYGALIEAAPYMMDDARAETWGKLFERALIDAHDADRRKVHPPTSIRLGGYCP